MCFFTKTITSKNGTVIVYCDSMFCFKYGKIIKTYPQK